MHTSSLVWNRFQHCSHKNAHRVRQLNFTASGCNSIEFLLLQHHRRLSKTHDYAPFQAICILMDSVFPLPLTTIVIIKIHRLKSFHCFIKSRLLSTRLLLLRQETCSMVLRGSQAQRELYLLLDGFAERILLWIGSCTTCAGRLPFCCCHVV